MTNKKSPYELPLTTLQKGFAMHCRLLGISKDTCVALVLLLNSKDLLIAMMKFMAIVEENGLKDGVDVTTVVVNMAAEMRDVTDKKIEREK